MNGRIGGLFRGPVALCLLGVLVGVGGQDMPFAQEGYCFRHRDPIAERGKCQGRIQRPVSSAAGCCLLGGVGWSEKPNGKRCTDACMGLGQGAAVSDQVPAMAPPGNLQEGMSIEEVIANGNAEGLWGTWSDWQPCSVTCGTGFLERRRDCNPPPNAGNVEEGFQCSGDRVEHTPCSFRTVCPVHGQWGQWSGWSECSATCGDTMARHRSCDSPPPSEGGNSCAGEDTDMQWCNGIMNCPVDGGWRAWSQWSPCSETCGRQGQRKRFRSCTNPKPNHGGATCIGDSLGIRSCTPAPNRCPVVGGWSEWGKWTCQAECANGGDGFAYRRRHCTNPKPKNGGGQCRGHVSQTTPCSEVECPVDGGWGSWSSWADECSSTCGKQSFRTRKRFCDSPAPTAGGLRCIGDEVDMQECSVDLCPDVTDKSSVWSSNTEETATELPCDDEDYDSGEGSGCRTTASGDGTSDGPSDWSSDGSRDVAEFEQLSSSFENQSPEYY